MLIRERYVNHWNHGRRELLCAHVWWNSFLLCTTWWYNAFSRAQSFWTEKWRISSLHYSSWSVQHASFNEKHSPRKENMIDSSYYHRSIVSANTNVVSRRLCTLKANALTEHLTYLFSYSRVKRHTRRLNRNTPVVDWEIIRSLLLHFAATMCFGLKFDDFIRVTVVSSTAFVVCFRWP